MEPLDQRMHRTVQLCTEAPKNHALEKVPVPSREQLAVGRSQVEHNETKESTVPSFVMTSSAPCRRSRQLIEPYWTTSSKLFREAGTQPPKKRRPPRHTISEASPTKPPHEQPSTFFR